MTPRLRRRKETEEEDAAVLKLGPEFNNAGCLLISEVKYLLEHRDESKAPPDTPVYNKTLEYVKTFTRFQTSDAAGAVRDILRREPQLTQFETAQIANLCPVAAEEAKSVIPSLLKLEEDRLQPLLDEIQTMLSSLVCSAEEGLVADVDDGPELPSCTPFHVFIAMQPSELEIRREVEVLRDLKRRSTAQGGPGAIPLDPDLPELPPSPSSPLSGNAWGTSGETPDQQEGNIADDPSHLFWVPARLHPELAPKEFRAFLKEHARDGVAGLQRANSASAAISSTSALGRRRSMLSKQYQPSESDGVENERVIVRRNKSSMRAPAPQLTINDLQKLDELAEQISESDDPTKIRNMLRRSLSLNISPSVTDQADDLPDIDDADSPIIPRGPNQILRRAARTKIRKPNLQGDGGGHRFPSTRRGRAQTIATSDGSEQDHEEPFQRPQAPTPEEVDLARPASYTDEALILDSYVDRRESLTSSDSHGRSEEDHRDLDRRISSSPPPMVPSVEPPSPEMQPSISQSPLIHQPTPQRHLTAPASGPAEAPLSRSPSPSYSDSGSTTEIATPMTSISPPEIQSSSVPGPSKPTKIALTQSPSRKEKEKKGLWKWGKEDKKKSKAESKEKEKEKEKEKDSGFFGARFWKKKQDDANSSSGLIHNGSGAATATALLGASKANRINTRSPSPQPVGHYARYPIHVERAIYRLSHIKLANARRPLLEQVLISNLMFWYLGIINKTTQPTATNPQNAAGGNVQGQSSFNEDKEAQEREREQREKAEKERLEREKAEQLKKENSRKGSLTRAPKSGGDSTRRAEMPVRGPQYESQHRAIDEEYGYRTGNGEGYGFGSSVQGSSMSSPRMGSAPPSPMPNSSVYFQYNNVRSPQPASPQPRYPTRTGSPTGSPPRTGSPTGQQSVQQPTPMHPGSYYFNYGDSSGTQQQSSMSYGLPPGAMLPVMDQAWLGVGNVGVGGKTSPSPPPSSMQSQFAYNPPSPSPPPQPQTPPRRPRSPPPNHLNHPRHPTTTPPGTRLPGRSLSATAFQQPSGKLKKGRPGSPDAIRRRSSDGGAYTEEDVPLAVWQQQQRASGRR